LPALVPAPRRRRGVRVAVSGDRLPREGRARPRALGVVRDRGLAAGARGLPSVNAPHGLVQPVPLRFLLDDTLRAARRSFRAISRAVALPMAVGASLLGFAQAFIQPIPGSPTRAPVLPGLDGFLAFMAAVVAFLAVYSACYMALLTAAADAHHGRG